MKYFALEKTNYRYRNCLLLHHPDIQGAKDGSGIFREEFRNRYRQERDNPQSYKERQRGIIQKERVSYKASKLLTINIINYLPYVFAK